MKKITILLLAFTIVSGNAAAQKKWKVALKFGPTMTKDHYEDIYPQSLRTNSQYALGLSTGFDFYRFYENNFFFKTGINYNMKTYKGISQRVNYETKDTNYYDYKIKESYLTIPLLLAYKFNIKNQMFYVAGGMEINYMFYSVFQSSKYGKYKTFSNSYSNIVPKLIVSVAYLYKINDRFTLLVNPEYIKGFGLEHELSIGDYLTSWRLNFGVIYKL